MQPELAAQVRLIGYGEMQRSVPQVEWLSVVQRANPSKPDSTIWFPWARSIRLRATRSPASLPEVLPLVSGPLARKRSTLPRAHCESPRRSEIELQSSWQALS